MSSTSNGRRRPGLLKRLIFRAPVLLYRLRLGWLFGNRFLMLAHRGRRTGKVRRTVVEVVRYDRATGERIIVSGYGATSDWYRNIQASPALKVHTGSQSFTPEQRFLSVEETFSELTDYERRHPRAIKAIARAVGLDYDGSEEARWLVAESLPAVSLTPKRQWGDR